MAASGHLASGPSGATHEVEIDGTKENLYVLKIDSLAHLAQVAKGLRNESRSRSDITPYPRGDGGRVLVSPPHLFPTDLHMILSPPTEKWAVSVLERRNV
jgi:hypothetical protein